MALHGRAALAAMLVHVWFGRSRAASLSEALGKATFYNNGTAHASDGALYPQLDWHLHASMRLTDCSARRYSAVN